MVIKFFLPEHHNVPPEPQNFLLKQCVRIQHCVAEQGPEFPNINGLSWRQKGYLIGKQLVVNGPVVI